MQYRKREMHNSYNKKSCYSTREVLEMLWKHCDKASEEESSHGERAEIADGTGGTTGQPWPKKLVYYLSLKPRNVYPKTCYRISDEEYLAH